VLVHGLTGNRENTWTEKKGKILWAERLLPTDLPQARIFTFGYDADVVRVLKTTSSNIVRDHGKALANDVAIRRMRTKSVSDTSCLFKTS
jgi:hypothetical protein